MNDTIHTIYSMFYDIYPLKIGTIHNLLSIRELKKEKVEIISIIGSR